MLLLQRLLRQQLHMQGLWCKSTLLTLQCTRLTQSVALDIQPVTEPHGGTIT